jgi:MFS family permease
MCVGIGEATLSPSAYSIIADYFRPHRLGLAIRVFGIGSAAGSGIALIIGGAVVNITTSIEHTELPVLDQVHGWGLVFLMIGLRQASADASV